ncbi:MAG: RidA family protein [Saccharopolyspora sp.]|uniref:RidA family protein n=1 Tax=unclassified Saccharopolyspora TaxID=2646250 RepID=UPI0025CFB898|nr:RidA family protein [Saccharopolyspora sp.]MBQ6642445.1 RidA family protein [Saccharopolyspora sp.]
MTTYQRVSGGSALEDRFGYSRAVRVGPWISVAGSTAAGPDGPVGGSDITAQTREALGRIAETLRQAGASTADVVRTRLFATDMAHFDRIGAVHREFFADVLPASTIVQVERLVLPELLIEVEADAYRAE